MESSEQDQAAQGREVILAKVNAVVTELGGWAPYLRNLRTPEYREEYSALKGKRVLIVDDSSVVIQYLIRELMVATDGNASALLYRGEDVAVLVREIIEKAPHVILMDYHLSEALKGTAVMEGLSQVGYAGIVVGSSSDEKRNSEFAQFGAVGCIDKTALDTGETVKKLALIVGGVNHR